VQNPPVSSRKPDPGIFLGILSLAFGFLIPLLQANGMDVNWQGSIAVYLVIIAVCCWSVLRYLIPHLTLIWRCLWAFVTIGLIGCLALYATLKQYRREHPVIVSAVENLCQYLR
jgi:hypothetical protein